MAGFAFDHSRPIQSPEDQARQVLKSFWRDLTTLCGTSNYEDHHLFPIVLRRVANGEAPGAVIKQMTASCGL